MKNTPSHETTPVQHTGIRERITNFIHDPTVGEKALMLGEIAAIGLVVFDALRPGINTLIGQMAALHAMNPNCGPLDLLSGGTHCVPVHPPAPATTPSPQDLNNFVKQISQP